MQEEGTKALQGEVIKIEFCSHMMSVVHIRLICRTRENEPTTFVTTDLANRNKP